VPPDLGGARTRRRTGRPAGHPTTWSTHPSCYLEDLYVAKPWRGGDIAHRLIQAVYTFADGLGAGSVYWLTQEYNAPARSLYDTLAHRTSFVVYQRWVAPKIPRGTADAAAALGRPLRCAKAGAFVFAGRLPEVHWSTPKREPQAQNPRSSSTKINKDVISMGGAAANLYRDGRERSELRPPAFLPMP
jgi:GNAT superfamily N-acetyltransferase